ncbi:MAG: ATP-binding cassette domain-containing protein, partial [Nitrososphaerota archaeon]|nr:ATP-binding cassette domain-containing protein [Nitrososphaerota archaeon]
FDSLRSLIKAGKSVVLITHKLYEVFEVADRITVLRKGRITYEGLRSETTNEKVVEAMIGKEVDLVNFQRGEKKFEGSMRAEGLTVYQEGVIRVDNVSFELNRGEILGIAAVAGNGEKELVEALFGLRKLASGKIYLEKEQIDGLSVKGRIRLGLGYIPEERLTRGVARGISLSLNSINHDHWWEPYTKNELLNFKEIREFATRIVKQFNVDSRSEEERVQNLSGGNIQKFIVGRELLRNPKYMIVVNPTAGLDVGATEGFRRYLMEFRNAGRGILLNSEDLDELLSLSDRIMVMHKGRIVGAFNRDKFDKLKIGALMLGKDIGG